MTKKASPPVDSLSFEQAIDELDQLVRKMESGDLSLDELDRGLSPRRGTGALTARHGSPARSRKSVNSKATC